MIAGKTRTGFEFTIKKTTLNNYELVENLAALEDNPLVLPSVLKQVLGEEQAEKLKDHVRDKEGIVPIDKLSVQLSDIFTSGGEETKNS